MLPRSTSATSTSALYDLIHMLSLFNRLNNIVCLVVIVMLFVNSVVTDFFLASGLTSLFVSCNLTATCRIY